MTRTTFLTVAACIAGAVGGFALLAPGVLLASKGVAPSSATEIWVREVGVALLALAVISFLVRRLDDSPGLRAFLIGNAVLQIGLFPIELLAYQRGVITKLSGIAPNTVLHAVLAVAFITYASRIRAPRPAGAAQARPAA